MVIFHSYVKLPEGIFLGKRPLAHPQAASSTVLPPRIPAARAFAPCRIRATEQRGIQRWQLQKLLDFLRRRCDEGEHQKGWDGGMGMGVGVGW